MAANEVQVVLPELAESVVEGEILEWHVAEGETIERDAPLLDVASDKANVELPSPYAGTVLRHLVAVGDMVRVDAPIAVIRLDGETAAASETDDEAASAEAEAEEEVEPAPAEDDGSERSLFRAD